MEVWRDTDITATPDGRSIFSAESNHGGDITLVKCRNYTDICGDPPGQQEKIKTLPDRRPVKLAQGGILISITIRLSPLQSV